MNYQVVPLHFLSLFSFHCLISYCKYFNILFMQLSLRTYNNLLRIGSIMASVLFAIITWHIAGLDWAYMNCIWNINIEFTYAITLLIAIRDHYEIYSKLLYENYRSCLLMQDLAIHIYWRALILAIAYICKARVFSFDSD